MSTSSSSSNFTSDTSPLLNITPGDEDDRSRRSRNQRQTLREAVRFIRRASSRRMMREPSMIVRDTAAEHLENRQSDWAYSKPVVVVDVIWNLAFVIVAGLVLGLSLDENPVVPLRIWLVGYGLQCTVHVVCVAVEFRRRSRNYATQLTHEGTSTVVKHLESANTMFSFAWWIVGFYWVSSGGEVLAQDSPKIYWLCIVFLAFDMFFVVFCIALACIIGIAVCCCLPCIIAVLYAVADQEGATKEDIEQLTKFKFQRVGDVEKLNGEIQGPNGGVMVECGTDAPIEHVLSAEDSECCICLSAYDDGAELRILPCGHHFHCNCIDKWLYINSTCPLCKYDILKSSNHGDNEV